MKGNNSQLCAMVFLRVEPGYQQVEKEEEVSSTF